jgi:hypothetical protein
MEIDVSNTESAKRSRLGSWGVDLKAIWLHD